MSKTGFIYKFTCKDDNIKDIYVGSTVNYHQRMDSHRKNTIYNTKHRNAYFYNFMRNNGGWDNWENTILETFKFNERNELITKEQEYINSLNASLNIKRAKQTLEERKEQKKQSAKKLYALNKEKIIARTKKWREENRDLYNQRCRDLYNRKKIN